MYRIIPNEAHLKIIISIIFQIKSDNKLNAIQQKFYDFKGNINLMKQIRSISYALSHNTLIFTLDIFTRATYLL